MPPLAYGQWGEPRALLAGKQPFKRGPKFIAMNSENTFTDRVSGNSFWEATKDSLSINASKSGKGAWFCSQNEDYPQGYVSQDALAVIQTEMAKDNSLESFKRAICMLTFCNVHGVDKATGEVVVVPSLMKTGTPPTSLYSVQALRSKE